MTTSPERWPLPARILRALSRPPGDPDYAGGTETHVGSHALDYVLKTVPGFLELIRGKSVLDYGCGRGDQAVKIKEAGAARVVGFDPFLKVSPGSEAGVEFTSSLPTEQFDVVFSCSSFEHFADPEREFVTMRDLTRERLVITWAEPWLSHNGSHMGFFTRVPWVNVFFPERSVFLVRSLYRDDGATRYEESGLGGALNRMTVRRFEGIVSRLKGDLEIEVQRNYATKGLPLVTKVPVVREFLTSACMCVLRRAGRYTS